VDVFVFHERNGKRLRAKGKRQKAKGWRLFLIALSL